MLGRRRCLQAPCREYFYYEETFIKQYLNKFSPPDLKKNCSLHSKHSLTSPTCLEPGLPHRDGLRHGEREVQLVPGRAAERERELRGPVGGAAAGHHRHPVGAGRARPAGARHLHPAARDGLQGRQLSQGESSKVTMMTDNTDISGCGGEARGRGGSLHARDPACGGRDARHGQDRRRPLRHLRGLLLGGRGGAHQ